VDEPALVKALESGTISGAGLDSFAPEPPPVDNPLWKLPNVIVSPHVAGVTEEARREVSLQTVRNVLALLRNEDVHPRYFVRA
jgi:D-3-phosphoglycerate dehydrogenase / 2-oxoglutarate reductase